MSAIALHDVATNAVMLLQQPSIAWQCKLQEREGFILLNIITLEKEALLKSAPTCVPPEQGHPAENYGKHTDTDTAEMVK